MFESPLLAPMAPYGSPIRFNPAGTAIAHSMVTVSPSVGKSPVSLPLNKRLAIKRPPGLEVVSPVKGDEAKIRDILWKSPAQDEDDAENADILPPETDQLGPPSPYAVQFDKRISGDLQDGPKISASSPVGITAHKDLSAGQKRVHSQSGSDCNLNKIPTLVGPNSLPYARCPS